MFLKTIFKNTTFQFVSRLITSSSSFLILLMVGALFGTQGYGSLTAIIAIVSLFYLIVDFGCNPFYLQEEETPYQFRSLLYSRLVVAVLIMILLFIFVLIIPFNQSLSQIYSSTERIGLLIFSFMLLANALLYSATALFQKKLSYQNLTRAQFIGSLCALVIAGICFVTKAPLLYFLFSLVVGGLISGIISVLSTKEKLIPITIEFSFTKDLVKKSLPYFLMLFINMLYFSVDTILLSVLMTKQAVGVYGLSYQVFEFLIAIPLFLSNSIYPILLSLQKNNRISTTHIVRYSLLYGGLSVGVGIVAWVAAPLVVYIKSDFNASILPLRILLLSLPFFFLTSFFQWILITYKQQLFLLWVYAGSLILNVMLNVIFIPQYSYVASAVITGVGELVVLLVLIGKIVERAKFSDNGN